SRGRGGGAGRPSRAGHGDQVDDGRGARRLGRAAGAHRDRRDAQRSAARRGRPLPPRSGRDARRFRRDPARAGGARARHRDRAGRQLLRGRPRNRLMAKQKRTSASAPQEREESRDKGIELVPRFTGQGYGEDQVRERREWLQKQLGVNLPLIASCAIPSEQMRGNIENPIGSVQMPLGIAGPLLIHGEHAPGTFYVPYATTEGALVRSYARGMVMLTRAGGVTARVVVDENVVCPMFSFESVADAAAFAAALPRHLDALRAEAESTTRHGRLRRVEARV